jgi:hypothetical protein
MTRIKESQSSLCRRHTRQELCISRSTFKGVTKGIIQRIITVKKINHYECPFRPSLHVVGIGVCLVTLWPNPARRDKPWHYIALEFQRYTKHLLATGNLYRQVGIVWGIPFPKRMGRKYGFLGELFKKYFLLIL